MREEKPLLSPAEELRKQRPRHLRLSAVCLAPLICLLFALVCAVRYGVFIPEDGEQPALQESVWRFTQLAPEGLGVPVEISVRGQDGEYTLMKSAEGYAIKGEDAPIDAQRAKDLLDCGASILARSRLEGEATQYGLTDDALQAEFTYENGETFTIIFGDAPATGEGRYAAVAGDASVYVVNATVFETIGAGKNALYALPDFSSVFTANTLMEVTIERSEKQTITIRRVVEENPFNTVAEFTTPIHYPANSERTATLFLAFEALTPVCVAAQDGADVDWGFDNPLARISLTGPKETIVFTLGRAQEQITLRVGEEGTVYFLAADAADFLQTATVAYLAEQLPGLVALAQVDELRITTEKENYALRIDRTGTSDAYFFNDKQLTGDAFRTIYQKAIGLLIDRYAPSEKRIEDACVTFTYALTNGNTWTIAFAPVNGEYDAVIRDGEADFLIAHAKVEAVLDTLQSYMEGKTDE